MQNGRRLKKKKKVRKEKKRRDIFSEEQPKPLSLIFAFFTSHFVWSSDLKIGFITNFYISCVGLICLIDEINKLITTAIFNRNKEIGSVV